MWDYSKLLTPPEIDARNFWKSDPLRHKLKIKKFSCFYCFLDFLLLNCLFSFRKYITTTKIVKTLKISFFNHFWFLHYLFCIFDLCTFWMVFESIDLSLVKEKNNFDWNRCNPQWSCPYKEERAFWKITSKRKKGLMKNYPNTQGNLEYTRIKTQKLAKHAKNLKFRGRDLTYMFVMHIFKFVLRFSPAKF